MIIRRLLSLITPAVILVTLTTSVSAQVSNLSVRAVSANISSGPNQCYEQAGRDILKALKPDIVAIQEFKAAALPAGTNDTSMRALVDEVFGTNFYYFKQTKSTYTIPNGIISRWPIIDSGTWDDPIASIVDRGFAWARIDLPGTNDLYVVSVHLYSSGSASDRNTEALALKSNIMANFPPNAWILLGGDFNTGNRSEAAVTTFKTFLSDSPIPADQFGDPDTNAGRDNPYDYILPSYSISNYVVPVVMPSRTFANGLVLDTRVYSPIGDLSPAVATNSGAFQMQHMAVAKNFLLPVFDTNAATVPNITSQPQSTTNNVGTSAGFSVTASGTAPLYYQWRFNTTNIAGANATNYSIANVDLTNAGDYTVIITNVAGSVTSSIAKLTVVVPPTNSPPSITANPASLTNVVGTTANFSVNATGTAPLSYQWLFNGTNISSSATNSTYSKVNVQTNDSGAYSVIITNIAGAVTSTPALLTVNSAPPGIGATNIVISQIYGGGGFAAAGYRNDFVELFNPNGTAVSLAGWSVQYASSTGTSWAQTPLNGSIAPYSYYLVMLSSNAASTVGIALPTADATNAGMNISATAGKLALTTNSVALSGANPVGGVTIADFVGYGSAASGYEGSGPVATQSGNTNSLVRKNGGFTDSNNNGEDFDILIPPAPRNSSSPANPPPSGPPAVAPTLSTPSLVGGQVVFQVTGTLSSNYVVLGSSNLSTWVPVQTNPAPFWFTNSIGQPQQYYRGTVAQ